jgi:hypothetical protein
MLSCRVGAIALALFLVFGGLAKAQDTSDQKIGIPIYDPGSKRYFAFMASDPQNTTWDRVYQQARGLYYKGVQGRLAIVDSFEVHDFLLTHWPLKYFEDAWIGLRYLCRARKLVWSDGKPFNPTEFAAWDKVWKQDIYFCGDVNDPKDWAPIAYSPQFTWIAKGRHKGYRWYFMEYPTGHP